MRLNGERIIRERKKYKCTIRREESLRKRRFSFVVAFVIGICASPLTRNERRFDDFVRSSFRFFFWIRCLRETWRLNRMCIHRYTPASVPLTKNIFITNYILHNGRKKCHVERNHSDDFNDTGKI